MRNWVKKLQIKGFVAGVIVTIMLSGTIMAVAQTVNRNITFGIRVNLNGQLLQLPADSQPFTMDGRTFLPVRALADAIELPVDFNSATNTVYLGNRFAGQRRPIQEVAPFFNNSGSVGSSWQIFAGTANRGLSSRMGGVEFSETIHFRTANSSGWRDLFTLHNLNAQFRNLTITAGGLDGTPNGTASLIIEGDGVELHRAIINSNALPTVHNVFVEGVRELRIRVVRESGGSVVYVVQAYVE